MIETSKRTYPFEHRSPVLAFVRPINKLTAILACAVLVFALVPLAPQTAYAENELSAAQKKVEETAAELDSANDRVNQIESDIEENSKRIKELKRELPKQEEASDESIRLLYRLNNQGTGLLEMILAAENPTDFFTTLEYVNRIEQRNLDTIGKLAAMKGELEEKQEKLQSDREEALDAADKASAALANAQEARKKAKAKAEAQRKAEEEAKRKAEEEGKKKAEAEEAAAKAKAAEEAEDATPEQPDNDGSTVADKTPKDTEITEEVSDDGNDWSSDKATFVAKWTSRIDAYLAGSELEGQGRVFAEAAWDYGVDPRWSPAISCIESGKGAHCFRSHNAWGWGSKSWGSWDEAIRAHVSGLARIYGYTLTLSAAKKYCPPNWRFWYNNVGKQMSKI